MPDTKVVRRRRIALASLIGLSLVLLTVFFTEPVSGTLHVIQRGAQEALAPLELGASRALKPARDLAGWTGDTLRAKGENERLRQELARLRTQLARTQTQARDAGQLRAMAELAAAEDFPQNVEPVTARVIGRSPHRWYSAIDIDKGRSDGVRVDQPVIAAGGLVGKVTSATAGSARVTLITDDRSAVSAQLLPDGAHGVVKGTVGRPDDLRLDYIERTRGVQEGDTVVTSGSRSDSRFDSLFPRGIPIGKVKRADPSELESYQLVHIEPFADLRRFDFVQVLTAGGGSARAALQEGLP